MDQREMLYAIGRSQFGGQTQAAVSAYHKDSVRKEVIDALRWSLAAAKASCDFHAVSSIAAELAKHA